MEPGMLIRAGLSAAGRVEAMDGPTLSAALRPLELLDLPEVYSTNGPLVDLVIYLVLFNGLAQAVLGQHLTGRGGRLVAGAVGTGLALALSGLGWATGFSLVSLGPLAVVMLLGLIGVVVFRTLQRLGASVPVAGSAVCLLLVLTLEGMASPLAERVEETFPFINLLAAGALLVLVWKGLSHLLPSGASGRLERLAGRIASGRSRRERRDSDGKVGKDVPEEQKLRSEVRKEEPEIRKSLRVIVRREKKESRAILRELKVVDRLLRDRRYSESEREALARAIRKIPPRRHRLHTLVEEVRELDRRLARFDLAFLHELREAMSRVPPAERPLMRKLVLEERRKIRSEERIQMLENFIRTYDANSAKSIEMAARMIVENRVREAIQWVGAGIRYEEEARRAIKRAQAVQRMLRRITRLELRQLSRAA